MRQAAGIGVFDSGVGGLTVVRALTERLPREELVYLGDTARVPYGSKSAETVARYSRMAARFLVDRGVKMVVVACNTASAFALEALRAELPLPVLGAIEPGARAAVAATRTGRIGVIGTLGTVRSGSYPRAIAALDPALHVTARACPLLVPLAEEGWLDDEVAGAIARRYLGELQAEAPDVDVLVLGCTHYPLLRPLLSRVAREVFGHDVTLVDSAEAMADVAHAELERLGLLRDGEAVGALRCFVTDDARIDEVGHRFLGRHLGEITRVDL
ncbi:MAG: glutamate racemase [Myxococcales bacterium]|nr:glutamate racemase [Myxococcales bacterium]